MFYPVMIEMEGKLVCIVGGGKVALRKARKLLEYGSRLRIISPKFNEAFNGLKGSIVLVNDIYKSEYIKDAFMVIAGTSDSKVNNEVSVFCREKGIICNVIDNVNTSDFILPSIVKRGDLLISVSTSGKSPVLSKIVKDEIGESYGEEYGIRVELLGEIREMILKNCSMEVDRENIFKHIARLDLEELKQWKKEYEDKLPSTNKDLNL